MEDAQETIREQNDTIQKLREKISKLTENGKIEQKEHVDTQKEELLAIIGKKDQEIQSLNNRMDQLVMQLRLSETKSAQSEKIEKLIYKTIEEPLGVPDFKTDEIIPIIEKLTTADPKYHMRAVAQVAEQLKTYFNQQLQVYDDFYRKLESQNIAMKAKLHGRKREQEAFAYAATSALN